MNLLAALLNPVLFYAGTAAVAAPILIHLLARRRYRRVRWAAMEFVLEAQKRNRRRMRLQELILLALRCLLVFLIGLVVARPFVTPRSWGAMLAPGGQARNEWIFLLDDSFSMGYVHEGVGSFDRAKQALLGLLDQARRGGDKQSVTVLRSSAPDSPLVAGAYPDERSAAELAERVEALEPSQKTLRLDAAIARVRTLLDESPQIGQVRLTVVSDFQKVDWLGKAAERQPATGNGQQHREPREEETDVGRAPSAKSGEGGEDEIGPPEEAADSPSGGGSPLAPLAAWAQQGRSLGVVLVAVGDRQATNRAVADVRPAGSRFVAGMPGELNITVANHGDAALPEGTVQVWLGGAPGQTAVVPPLPPRQSAVVPVPMTFPTWGDETVRVELPAGPTTNGSAAGAPGDRGEGMSELALDDTRHAAVEVEPAVRILVVDGEPGPDAASDEVHLLTTALAPAGQVSSGNTVQIIDESRLEDALSGPPGGTNVAGANGADSHGEGPPHVVVLANVYRISPGALVRLQAFVRKGGGLLIFVGDQVDAAWYNESFYERGRGLMPELLGAVVEQPGPGTPLAESNSLHPVMRVFVGSDNPFLRRVAFGKYFAVLEDGEAGASRAQDTRPEATGNGQRATDAAADLRVGRGGDAIGPETPRSVVARFADAERTPAIIEQPFGKGRVVLVNSTCDLEWNNWGRDPSYIVTLLELARYLCGTGVSAEDHLVGDPIVLRFRPGQYQPDATLRTPDYPEESEIGLALVPEGDGAVLRWDRTDRAGVYRLRLRRSDGGEQQRLVAVNVDPRESDLSVADEQDLRRAMPEIPFAYVTSTEQVAELEEAGGKELWRGLLAAGLAVLLVEQVLAFAFGRRR